MFYEIKNFVPFFFFLLFARQKKEEKGHRKKKKEKHATVFYALRAFYLRGQARTLKLAIVTKVTRSQI